MLIIKYSLIYSKYNPETGVSKVWIKNRYGTFMGKSRLHKEDKDYVSSYAGCRFAEMKAIIKTYKRKVQNLKLRLKELIYFQSMLEQTKGYNSESIEARKLRKRIYLLKEEIKKEEHNIDVYEENFQKEIKQRDASIKFLRNFQKKKNETDKND